MLHTYCRIPIFKHCYVCSLKKKIENTLFPQMFTCILRYFSYFFASVYLTNVEKRWIMTGHYCLCRITNIKASSQAYKKVALRNSCNFWHKVMKKFIYLYDLMIKSAKRKLWLWLLSARQYLHVVSENKITELFSWMGGFTKLRV